MAEWQDIETAPKDGTKVLLWMGGSCPVVVAYYDDGKEWDESNGWWRYVEELLADIAGQVEGATHWMPLPEPPK